MSMRTKPKKVRKAFGEMDLGLIGVVGLTLTFLVMAAALNIGKITDLVGHATYTADFTEAGGLRSGDDVRVAGISVGEVKRIDLAADHVEVAFGLGDLELGDTSRALVKADNALGAKYLEIDPSGHGDVRHIPRARTNAGFAVNEELGKLTRHTGEIDTAKLAESFESISAVLAQTPDEFKAALEGVSALSQTLSSRDEELATLLERASSVSGLLAERNKEITSIVADGSALFHELELRREVIGRLLHNIEAATQQMVGFVRENKDTLKPALMEIKKAAELVREYRDTLDYVIKNVAVYARSLGEGVSSGPFFQAYLANLQSPEDLVTGGLTGLIKQEASK
ncbi:MCE family protein [Nocardioides sp. NPDC051685]|uniref:MCE family protein n=1 Tax=Nocardioides sp. NPDC051685 TaxID=3364334 RepID=UPI0037AD73A3